MTQDPTNAWNAERYSKDAGFVRDAGLPLVELLAPKPGERVLDLGCGPGELTRKIADTGADVVGLDSSETMIARARAAYPELRFELGRGEALEHEQNFDAIFSNAALHWMPRADAVAAGMFRALRPGGRLIAEFGGHRNIAEVMRASNQALDELGITSVRRPFAPWYFPRLGEYAALLEASGFTVRAASWFPRPSSMPDREGQSGMAAWLDIFASELLPLSVEQRAAFVARVEAIARERLYRDGIWWIDYVRLRIDAVK